MTAGSFHSVEFPALAKLLRELGFTEGVLAYHTLGDSSRYLRRVFGEENTYPYARSVFYALKALGLVENPGSTVRSGATVQWRRSKDYTKGSPRKHTPGIHPSVDWSFTASTKRSRRQKGSGYTGGAARL
ncbi:MAG: hypothetical protein QW123_03565 [Desulfurococcaceae archaeon]